MKLPSARAINFFAFLLCAILLLISYYFQFVKGMQPCLLCILQRWAMGLLTVIFLLAAIQNPKKIGIKLYAFATLIIAIFGTAAAGRQTWLQHQPPNTQATCLPGLKYLLHMHPFPVVLKLMFHGGSDCAEVIWRFLGMTMAEWTLIFFILLALVSIILLVLPKRIKE